MLLDKNTIIKVTNRDNGSVGYTIPELNLHRQFQSGETKEITLNELRQLSYLPGGRNILKKYLVLDNQDAIDELIGAVEPEYFYTEEDIKNLLTNGSLAEFEDCLDFAPVGTINLLKKLAVDTKLNDVAKRKAILNKTGFNVDAAIRTNELSAESDEEVTEQKQRRVAVKSKETASESAPVRRTTTNYKVVSKN